MVPAQDSPIPRICYCLSLLQSFLTGPSTTTNFTGPNNFMRFDYQVNGNNSLSFRWTRERILTVNDSIENDLAIRDAARHENDSGDQVVSVAWTSVLNN